MARSERRGRNGGLGVAARILLLAFVPVVGFAVSLGMLWEASRARLESSDAISDDIDTLRDLAVLHRAVTADRLTTVGLVRLRQLGVSEEIVNERFGVDVYGMLDTAHADETASLAALADDDVIPVADIAAALADIRSSASVASADPTAISDKFDVLLEDVGAAVDRETLEATASDTTATAQPLGASMARLHAAIDAHRFGALQLGGMVDVWFADEASRARAVVALAEYTAQFERSMTLLRAADDPAIDEWATVFEAPAVVSFEQALAAAIHGTALPSDSAAELVVAAFSGAADRQDGLADLVSITSDDAERQANEARQAAIGEVLRLTLVGVGAALLTLALAGWSAYSIALPLRRLIERAGRIRDGDLSADPSGLTGPHDLRLAAETVEQLVENLRLLDAKSVALSRCDLDDPVLQEDLPGRLGSSLQQSTHVLRESIAAREELQERLWHAANHDSLTAIANRSSAIDQLRVALDDAAGASVAVLFVDLDDFKRANDAHGHAVGDEILRVTARRMRDVVRPTDIVGRLGGDEFVVGLVRMDQAGAARSFAERLLAAIRAPIEVGTVQVAVGASIGVALGSPGERPSDVMARADLAVYQAKQSRSSIHVYDEALHREVQSRTTIEKDLAAALDREGELELHYQPIVDAYSGDVLRVEALLRWDRPGHGSVSPELFIPAAEASGLIIDVDRWVLGRAMAQAASWVATSELDAVGIAINVSGRHVLSDSFVETVRDALSTSGIDPGRVTLELTESVLVDDLERAAANLRAVRELGVSVYVDDFGTGYTSIAHLHALPIDGIKIDRSFVSSLPGARELTLVRTLIELGLQLGLTVVAEGVETEEQQSIVASLGCELVQGFLVGRPVPASEITRALSAYPLGS